MVSGALRNEALQMLHGRGAILDAAREVSQILRDAGIAGAVIGGVAVVLHGHVRTTRDVDVFVPDPAQRMADALRENGFKFNARHREFVKADAPVHLVLLDQIKKTPKRLVDIDEVRTVSLPDLIAMKLRSGMEKVVRAQDIADVIGLIRCHSLTGTFAARLPKELRAEFRKLVRAVVTSRRAHHS